MTAVWDHARVGGGALIVLLAMADWANDDGTGVYPKQATLATKARLSDRQVRNVLAELEEAGYICQDGKRGHTVNWRVESDPEKIATRNPVSGSSGSPLPTEPSTEPPEGEANASPSKVDDFSIKYAKPETPGSGGAPWLVLELAWLMHDNDPKTKLPAAVRPLTAENYSKHRKDYGVDERRELLDRIGWPANLKTWLDPMRMLVDIDEREMREIAQVLRWCQHDDFWKTNILSPAKFRKQYPQLRLRWLEEGGSSATPGTRPGDRGPSTAAQLDAMAKRAA